MLRVSNLTKYFADIPILHDVQFTLGRGERAAIVGPNGCGKTTLLRIIAGLAPYDGGSVWLAPGTRVGYLRQSFFDDEARPIDTLLAEESALWSAHIALDLATAQLGDAQDNETLSRYQEATERFESLGGYAELARMEDVLHTLDLQEIDPRRPIGSLSGGQKKRLALAALLIASPDLLLLDEPTNHLDVEALHWLERVVCACHGAVLLVSHDRVFIDATVDRVLDLNPETQRITPYHGGYTAYAAARQAELEDRWDRYRRQERERARIEADIRRTREQARGVESANRADYDHGDTRGATFAARNRATKVARKAVVRERKLERAFDAERTIGKPVAGWHLKLDFPAAESGAREVLRIDGVRKRLGDRQVLDGIALRVRHGERLAITGPNGGGKTTLLRMIAGTLAPDSGSIRLGIGIVPAYLSQEQEGLDPQQTPLQSVRHTVPMTEADARTFLHGYLFAEDMVFTPIGALSYGERARLALARLVLSGANLLLLDEPTNHLDIASRERLEAALARFRGTTIAVLHDRRAIERLATRTLELRDGALVDRSGAATER